MARRKDDNIMEVFYGLFMSIPAWSCIPIALAAFIAVNLAVAIFAASNPVLKGLASFSPIAGGCAAVLILLAGFKAAINKAARRKLLARQTGIESIRELSWSAFELLVGQAYRQQGYDVEETGGGGSDGGVDLKLRRNGTRTIVQCKQWKTWKVGVKPVRELYGVLMAENADQAIFVTSGVFTADAKAFASGKPIQLVDGETLVRLIATAQHPEERSVAMPQQQVQEQSSAFSSPACPKCNGGMVLRTARRGTNAGSQFWGCSKYPECSGTRRTRTVSA